MKRRLLHSILTCIVTLIFMLSLNVTTLAHSGRTDSNGGHKDNKNASGLGSYHYHCGGHPAHLHDGGVCPYKTQTPSTTYTPPETTTSPETTPPETNIPPETTAPPETTTPPKTNIPPETTTPPKTNIPPVTTASPTLTAMPTSSSVYVNGKQVSFDAYCINNSNYFKLRDLAFALNGTEKQFEVTWNSEGNAIEISCGIPYTAVGGELQGGGNGSKSPILTTSQLYVDRKEISLTVYSIEGYNYFRLRDIGDVCSFNVTWENNSIKINT